jgi:hypothetical protein
MITAIRDWWRGYSQADVASAITKIGRREIGEVVILTDREMRAFKTIQIINHLIGEEAAG